MLGSFIVLKSSLVAIITRGHADPDLDHHMTARDHNQLRVQCWYFISNAVSCIVLASYCYQNMPFHAHGFIILLTSSPTIGERFYHNTVPWCGWTGCAWMPFRVSDSNTCLHSILMRIKFAHRTWLIWQKIELGYLLYGYLYEAWRWMPVCINNHFDGIYPT